MKEEVIAFGDSVQIFGVLTEPVEKPVHDDVPAILLVNAGLLGRIGRRSDSRLYGSTCPASATVDDIEIADLVKSNIGMIFAKHSTTWKARAWRRNSSLWESVRARIMRTE